MKKQDKYLKRAIASIGVVFGENEPNNEQELDVIIKDFVSEIEGAKNHIESLKYAVENAEKYLDLITEVKRQILVEKYKDLNPKCKIY